jgi:hypothetical protein
VSEFVSGGFDLGFGNFEHAGEFRSVLSKLQVEGQASVYFGCELKVGEVPMD